MNINRNDIINYGRLRINAKVKSHLQNNKAGQLMAAMS